MSPIEERELEREIADAAKRRAWKADLEKSHREKISNSFSESKKSRLAGERDFCHDSCQSVRPQKISGGSFMHIQLLGGEA